MQPAYKPCLSQKTSLTDVAASGSPHKATTLLDLHKIFKGVLWSCEEFIATPSDEVTSAPSSPPGSTSQPVLGLTVLSRAPRSTSLPVPGPTVPPRALENTSEPVQVSPGLPSGPSLRSQMPVPCASLVLAPQAAPPVPCPYAAPVPAPHSVLVQTPPNFTSNVGLLSSSCAGPRSCANPTSCSSIVGSLCSSFAGYPSCFFCQPPERLLQCQFLVQLQYQLPVLFLYRLPSCSSSARTAPALAPHPFLVLTP
ncbi:hypothetical protein AOLI_G00292310 [Acnodon oligacanthus]